MAVCFSQTSGRRSNRLFSPHLTDARLESQAPLVTNGLRLAAKAGLRSDRPPEAPTRRFWGLKRKSVDAFIKKNKHLRPDARLTP